MIFLVNYRNQIFHSTGGWPRCFTMANHVTSRATIFTTRCPMTSASSSGLAWKSKNFIFIRQGKNFYTKTSCTFVIFLLQALESRGGKRATRWQEAEANRSDKESLRDAVPLHRRSHDRAELLQVRFFSFFYRVFYFLLNLIFL